MVGLFQQIAAGETLEIECCRPEHRVAKAAPEDVGGTDAGGGAAGLETEAPVATKAPDAFGFDFDSQDESAALLTAPKGVARACGAATPAGAPHRRKRRSLDAGPRHSTILCNRTAASPWATLLQPVCSAEPGGQWRVLLGLAQPNACSLLTSPALCIPSSCSPVSFCSATAVCQGAVKRRAENPPRRQLSAALRCNLRRRPQHRYLCLIIANKPKSFSAPPAGSARRNVSSGASRPAKDRGARPLVRRSTRSRRRQLC